MIKNHGDSSKGMISFDLLVFMLGVTLIIYVSLIILLEVNHRMAYRMLLVSQYNWALEVADYLIRFGASDDYSFHDHEILDEREYEKIIRDLNYENIEVYSGELGTTIDTLDTDDDTKTCVTRYGVTELGSVGKLVVCIR